MALRNSRRFRADGGTKSSPRVGDGPFSILRRSTRGAGTRADTAPYFAWKVSPTRFAITEGPEAAPVIGYVMKNTEEDSWSVERRGRVLARCYGSLDEAAQILVSLGGDAAQGLPG